MKLMLVATAAFALITMAGCTEYPASLRATMALALPPYHQGDTVDMDTAAGMTPVQGATHNWSVRAPF